MKTPAHGQFLQKAEGEASGTRPQPATVTEESADNQTSRSALDSAWRASHPAWRAGAVVTAIVALAAITSPNVPVASGLATAIVVCAALIDVQTRRLPNTIVAVAAATFISVVAIDAVAGATTQLTHITIGLLVFAGPLLALHLISPASMGFGDVKIGVVLGAALGAVDWRLAITALAIASGITATVGLMTRARTIAFGPGLVAATALALAANSLLLPYSDPQPNPPNDSASDTHNSHVWSPTP